MTKEKYFHAPKILSSKIYFQIKIWKIYRVNISKAKNLGYNIDKLSRLERILLIMTEKKKLRLIAGKDKELITKVEKIEKLSKDPNIVKETIEKIGKNMDLKEAEEKSKKEIAKKLLQKGMDIEEIAEITELSEEEILK